MLKNAMYFLFALSFLAAFNGYATEEVAVNEVVANDDVEVPANDGDSEVADNTDIGDDGEEKDSQE